MPEFDIDSALVFLEKYQFLANSFIIDYFVVDLFGQLPASWQLALADLDINDILKLLRPEMSKNCVSNGGFTANNNCQSAWEKSGNYEKSARPAGLSPLPLSFLCFQKCCHYFQLSRQPRQNAQESIGTLLQAIGSDLDSIEDGHSVENDAKMRKNLTWPDNFPDQRIGSSGQPTALPHQLKLHVKPKKQHEILRLGSILNELCGLFKFDRVVDIGSGHGHLARYLTFGNGLSVTCVEADVKLVDRARTIDEKLRNIANKLAKTGGSQEPTSDGEIYRPNCVHFVATPEHVAQKVEMSRTAVDDRCSGGSVQSVLSHTESYCLTGLHACGDLSGAILRHAVEDPHVKVVVSAGCCYMKLNGGLDKPGHCDYGSSGSDDNLQGLCGTKGFPLSTKMRDKGSTLSYMSRELACHALEQFSERLLNDRDKMKVHCYRAILEKLIVTRYPEKTRLGLHGFKNAHLLSFEDYCSRALQKLPDVSIPPDFLADNQPFIDRALAASHRVLIYYCLRLMLAPVVESVILWDRVMYLRENGMAADCLAVFDPAVSARNLVVVGVRPPQEMTR